MCRHCDILINIFSYRWHIAHSDGALLWGRNNAMQQQIIRAFKWECLGVIATICICLKNLRGNLRYRSCHMFWQIILNTVKIRANVFPFSSSSRGLQGVCNHAVHFFHSSQEQTPHALSNNRKTWKQPSEQSRETFNQAAKRKWIHHNCYFFLKRREALACFGFLNLTI